MNRDRLYRHAVAVVTCVVFSITTAAMSPLKAESDAKLVASSAKRLPPEFDLELAIAWAVEHNLSIQRAAARVDVREGELIHAQRPTPSNPKLSFSTGVRNAPNETFVDKGIRLEQEFWLANQGKIQTKAVRQRKKSAQRQLDFLVSTIKARVRRAFLETLVAQKNVVTARETIQVASEIVSYARTRLDVGEGNAMELNNALIARARAENELEEAKTRRARTRLDLLELLSVEPPYDVQLEGELAMPKMNITNIDRVLTASMDRRGDLTAAARDVAAAQQELRLSKREIIPNLTVFGKFETEEDSEIGGFGFSVPLPVLHQFRGEVGKSRATLRQRRIERKSLKVTVRKQVLAALQQYRSARSRTEAVSETMLQKAKENVELLKEALRNGEVGASAITTAQNTLLDVRNDYIEALESLVEAVTKLERATGGMIHASFANGGGTTGAKGDQ